MTERKYIEGHLLALLCVLVWGSTYVVSKSLLDHLQPVQLMLARFVIAYIALWIICPKWYFRWREEWRFLLMALFSNTLYCWAENTALTLTQASNVSILVSTSPIVAAVLMSVLHKDERLSRRQSAGFCVAFVGVILVVCNGVIALRLRPMGDMLALLAACSWATYGLLLRRWGGEYKGALITRKLMFYGIVTVLPMVLADGTAVDFAALLTAGNIAKVAYLGLVGSALCYLCWSVAVQRIGVLRANLYIYMVPLVALLAGVLVLHETVTWIGVAGILLVISGMALGTLRGTQKTPADAE